MIDVTNAKAAFSFAVIVARWSPFSVVVSQTIIIIYPHTILKFYIYVHA